MTRFTSNALAGSFMLAFCAAPALARWQPDKPISIIVPRSAGGSTDRVTRVVAPLLEKGPGTKTVVVNRPGASGSTGTRAALDAPRDGYTWTANAIADNATYAIAGLIDDTSIDGYRVYLHVANVPVVSVDVDAPYEGVGQLLEAMETADVTVGTAGVNSSGGMALPAIKESAGEGAHARMIAYDGGNPAVLAAAGGEVEATTQLASEQSEMIRAGRLRALAVLSDEPLEIEGIARSRRSPSGCPTSGCPKWRPRPTTSVCSSRSALPRRSTTRSTRSGRNTSWIRTSSGPTPPSAARSSPRATATRQSRGRCRWWCPRRVRGSPVARRWSIRPRSASTAPRTDCAPPRPRSPTASSSHARLPRAAFGAP